MPLRHRILTFLLPVALSGLLATAPVLAQAPGDAPAMPSGDREAATRAERLGRQLYLHDHAAWLATDAMLADKRTRSLRRKLGGWLTEPGANGIRVIFISDDDTPRRLFEIDVDDSERLSDPVIESSEPLTAAHLAQRKARDLAVLQPFMRCAKKYNSVVLPSTDRMRVYLLPAYAKAGVHPIGGYHLFEIDPTGERILSSRKFSNGCLDLDENAAGKDRSLRVAGLMATHLLDPHPTEVHVFVSLHSRLPLSILTVDNKTVWSVKKGEIASARRLD